MDISKIKESLSARKTKTLIIVLFFVCVLLIPCLPVYASGSALLNFFKDPFGQVVGWLLLGVQEVCLMLLSIAGSIFAAAIDPQNISGPTSGILNKQAIKDIWIMVRDVFNMVFILVLLFAAFCTIFQIEKWNIKKVWLAVLINALLVNFSFAIARFIIDVSNVAMYFFVNNMFASSTGSKSGSSIMANFGSTTKLEGILMPSDFVSQPIAYEIMIIIFTFILAMTLLIIAALFVIRLVMLAILIMFSPIGFVGYIFPSTHKFADQWWNQLFNYSFFAPIMIFMMAIAIKVSQAIGDENYNFFVMSASDNTTNAGLAKFIASAAFFMIPVIILWVGLGVAKSMSIAGADAVVSNVKKGGKWLSGVSFAQKTYQAYRARRDQTKGDRLSNRLGTYLGNKQDQLRGVFPGYTGDRASQRFQSAESARVAEEAKLRDTANMTISELRDLAVIGDKSTQAAANLELATRGVAELKELNTVRSSFGETSQVFKQMQNKIKTYDPVTAFQGLDGKVDWTRVKEHINSNQFDLKKINSNSLRNSEFMNILFDENAVDAKSIERIRNSGNADAIKGGLKELAAKSKNIKSEKDKAIHLAAFAQIGDMVDTGSNTVNEVFANKVFSSLDRDTAKRIKSETVRKHANRLPAYVKPSAYKDIVLGINDNKAAKELNTAMQNAKGTANAEAINRVANTDPNLRHITNNPKPLPSKKPKTKTP